MVRLIWHIHDAAYGAHTEVAVAAKRETPSEIRAKMYSKIDPLSLAFEIGVDDYVASLAAKHAGLERAIEEERGRPAPDCLSLTDLKRRKLKVKDEIARLRTQEIRATGRTGA